MRHALAAARSARVPEPARLAALAHIECVVIIGSSCVGKTTLVDAVRGSDLVSSGRVDVPIRLITRPPRTGDSVIENLHVTTAELDAEVRAGTVGLRWIRHIADRALRYGFRQPRAGALPVYSANNAILAAAAEVEPAGALAGALIVGVHAPDSVRATRFAHRSPDLRDRRDEVAHRLGDLAERVYAHAHVVLENHGELEHAAGSDLVAIVRALLR